MFNTPILFLLFNRPDTTKQVFEAIRKIKPKQLFIAADGPRLDRAGEKEKCRETRSIITKIDWECEVKTLFQPVNLGCKVGVSSAINWFFNNVEEGIILEDDCVPSISFFPYCSELLGHYRNDKRVMMISGNNFLFNKYKIQESYYFSSDNYVAFWGWATWRRAWQKYDLNMSEWPVKKNEHWLELKFNKNKKQINYWMKIFNDTYNNLINTWDFQFAFSIWLNECYIIHPKYNLVSNIGFRSDATHCKNKKSLFDQMESYNIQFPILHPSKMNANCKADKISFNILASQDSFLQQVLRKYRIFKFNVKLLISERFQGKSGIREELRFFNESC